MKKKLLSLVLAAVMALSLLPTTALAAKINVSNMPGHEMLSILPATLQRPAYPATVRQTDPLMTRFTDFDQKEETWPYEQSLKSVFQEIVDLTDSLIAGKTTDTQKVKAIFDWVSQNIQYGILIDGIDEEGDILKVNAYADPLQVYIRRHARCEGYALMCQFMCAIAGVPTAYIAGQVHGGGILHAWNAALADGKWVFFDATWSEWDMAPNYHETTDQIAYYDGVFLIQAFPKGASGYDVRMRMRTGFSCPDSVTVPDGVTWVDLRNAPNLTDLTFSDSVRDVYLTGCTGLTDVTLPNGVTCIEGGAFNGCTSLRSVNIPGSVTNIGNSAFMGCTSLKSITIPNGVTTLENLAFAQSGLTSVTVPGSVTSMEAAFYECADLESVKLDRGITSIGYSTFQGCTSLKNVTISDGVTTIEGQAFMDCTSLESVTVPDGVTKIDKMAFFGCTNLKHADLPDSVTDLDSSAFSQCPNLQNMPLPAGLTTIPDYAFRDRTDLTSYTIPDNVTSIGYMSFQDCTSLTSVTIPSSVTSIGNYAFSGCSSLTAVTIPAGVTQIGASAFYGCTGLTSMIIPNGVTSLESSVFALCSGLTSVTIPNSVTSIGDYAFSNCTGLTSITIPNSVTSIGRSFNGCINLKSIVIPNSVTSIGNFAFHYCTGLESVTIPDSVTSIEMWAFKECTSLKSITLPNRVATIANSTFADCTSLTSVAIPSSVTTIDVSAFEGCRSLTDVYYGGTEAQWKAIQIGDKNKALTSATIHYNSVISQPTDPTVGGFTDVKTGDYFAQPVLWAVEKNITTGTSATTFSPNQNCTAAQILTFLWRANGSPKPTTANPFSDVKSSDYYADAAAWAYEKGMVSGIAFGGDAPCTRSMAVTYMWKAAGSPNAGTSDFTDIPANADYAQAVAWAVEQGVTEGTSDTTFSPDSVCTRGQIAAFLYRGLAK